MATKPLDEQIGHSLGVVDVRVAHAAGGGWDVMALLGERILAIQHCDDWHKAERAYLRMSGNTRLHRIEAA